MRINILLISAIFLSFNASSKCWVVTNLSGYGAMDVDSYEYSKDKITNGVFQVSIDGDKAGLFNVGGSIVSSGMAYLPVSTDTMAGIYHDNLTTTVETWSITKDNKLLYSKVINSSTAINSTKSFVGDVVGTCNTKP